MAVGSYPPAHHLLSDLQLEADIRSISEAVVSMPVTPHLLGADGGVRVGVLATLVDVVGGAVAVRAVLPDWMATADLTVQCIRPARGPVVEARAQVLRRGRTTLVIEARVFDVGGGQGAGADSLVAWASMTFVILPRERGTVAGGLPPTPAGWTFAGSGLDRPVLDAVGIAVDEGSGEVSLSVSEYVHNSFGAVQGGVMAIVAEVAGLEAIARSAKCGRDDVTVTDLHVAYLALGRSGPIVGLARALGVGGRRHATVELVDDGTGRRVTTVATMSGTVGPFRALGLADAAAAG